MRIDQIFSSMQYGSDINDTVLVMQKVLIYHGIMPPKADLLSGHNHLSI